MRPLPACLRLATAVSLTALAMPTASAADIAQRTPIAAGIVGDPIAGEVNCSHNATGEPGIPLYAAVGGAISARLVWADAGVEGCAAFLVSGGRRESLIGLSGTREVSYEALSLLYYETRAAHALIFANAHPPGYWVRIQDLPGGRLQRWAEVLTASARFGYQGYDGVELRERPTDSARVLVKLRERGASENPVHQVLPIGEVSGNWGKFEVTEFNGDFDGMSEAPDAKPTGRKWTGWIYLVEPDGGPRFWFYARD